MAILDTGVDRNHPDLAGKVVYEACYSTTDPATAYFSACPNGQNSQIGTGAAAPPSRLITGFDHGTHVAAIAAGVAPDAKIVAIQVFSRVYENAAKQCTSGGRRSPCTLTRQSDYIKGLERVIAVRSTYNIVAVNMSLGGGAYASVCDSQPQFTSVKLLIDILRSNGVATVIAAGNDSLRGNIGAPACISSAISVGATSTFPDDASGRCRGLLEYGRFHDIAGAGHADQRRGAGDDHRLRQRQYPGRRALFQGRHIDGCTACGGCHRRVARRQTVGHRQRVGQRTHDERAAGHRPAYGRRSSPKRRLDVYAALCKLIACDPDDFRTLALGAALQGTISSGDTGDTYYFDGEAGQRIVVTMQTPWSASIHS